MQRPFVAALLAVALSSSGCHFMRTDFILETLNRPATPAPGAPTIGVATRVARLTRDHLADAYLDPTRVSGWMSAMAADPHDLEAMKDCLASAPASSGYSRCYQLFQEQAIAHPKWGVPVAAPIDLAKPSAVEIDAERFLANVFALGPSLAALQTALGKPIGSQELKDGLALGAREAASYLNARRWKRELRRPSNALVMSGGSANGAFSAGFVWRLTEILQACRNNPLGGCGDSRIDLVAGTSTGSLIGVLVDLFFTPGQEQAARDLLVENYTCRVESDLYCVNSNWDWKLLDDVRGLMRFDGIHQMLDETITPALADNDLELVTMAVDFASGDVYAVSDQDPADSSPPGSSPEQNRERHDGRVSAVMGSVVEPFFSDPVDWVPGRAGRVKGTFIDGGLRSGLPVLQALQRGAERVLVIANSGIEPDRIADPKNAFGILMRSLDLMVGQPKIAELQQAELGAVARRFTEYNACKTRLSGAAGVPVGGEGSRPAPSSQDLEDFCSRRGQAFSPPRPTGPVLYAATGGWMGAPWFQQVESSWRSSWVYRPEGQLETAQGYSFHPKVMRPLFLSGVETFQSRCAEFLGLFEIDGDIAEKACAEPVAAVRARADQSFADEKSCTASKPPQRTCNP
ncbi:MAG: patatin-like phospholipase family protein [Myxococcaceae bacterium]